MITTFACKETKKIWEGSIALKLPINLQRTARRKLRMLNNAKKLSDLIIPPSNHLEILKGKRQGEYSIRVNLQWRICFMWEDGHVHNVKIEDYH